MSGAVVGAAAAAVSIGTTLMGGGSSSGGGNVAGGGYYDPYKDERPQWFNKLQTLMGEGGTQSTALSYADWLKQNPQTSGGSVSTSSNDGWVHVNNKGSGSSRAAYDQYVKDFQPTTTGGGPQGAIDMVLNSPTYMGGYQSGQRALNANLASKGLTQSGAEQLALQGYGQDYFNQQYQNLYNQYTGLSKATDAPLSMANQNQLAFQQQQANQTNLGSAFGSLTSNLNKLNTNASWMPASSVSMNNPSNYNSSGVYTGPGALPDTSGNYWSAS